jgi:diguanylate cyclase (GGDEF)-like protein
LINQTQEIIHIKDELYNTFINYLNVYLVQRNLPGTLALFSSTFTGFGTGIDENGYSTAEFIKCYQRDFQQAPNPMTYKLETSRIQPITSSSGIVFGKLNVTTTIQNQNLKLNNLRISIVFHKVHQQWLIEHMHLSFPTQVHTKDESYPIKEIEARSQVLEKMVHERTHELEIAKEKLEKLAETDCMTGLYNRMKLDQILSAEIQRAQRYQSVFSIILFDLDNFKEINDNYGHQTGDQVLTELAKVIGQRVRSTDYIGRWGGDEFMIISPETNLENASLLAEIIRVTLKTHDFGLPCSVTSSFGITSWKENDIASTLIDRVDKALYKSKRSGKNQISN